MSAPAPAAPPTPPVKKTPMDDKGFMDDMLSSIGKVVTPDGKIELAPPPAEGDVTKPKPHAANVSLGEMVAEEERRKKAGLPAAEPAPEPAPEPAAAAPTPTPAAPTPTPPAAPTPVSRLKKKDEPAPVVAPAPAPAPVAAAVPVPSPSPSPLADPEAAYIATLSPEQRDELEMAAFAETKFPELKGKRSEILGYFKKVDQHVQANPNETTDELDQFLKSNKPQWQPGQRRKVETAFITQEATKAARKEVMDEVQPKLTAAEKKVKELEVEPVVRKAVDQFEDLITSPTITPEGMESIPAEVTKMIREKGYKSAAEAYPLEAPIFSRT